MNILLIIGIILLILWILGLVPVLHIAATIVWIFLIVGAILVLISLFARPRR